MRCSSSTTNTRFIRVAPPQPAARRETRCRGRRSSRPRCCPCARGARAARTRDRSPSRRDAGEERPENLIANPLGDSRPVVANVEPRASVSAAVHRDDDRAAGRQHVDRVDEQVQRDLVHLLAVTKHERLLFRCDLLDRSTSFAAGLRPREIDRAKHRLGEPQRLDDERPRTATAQQAGDHRVQTLHFIQHDLNELAGLAAWLSSCGCRSCAELRSTPSVVRTS